VGKPSVVTIGMDRPLELLSPIPQVNVPDGISLESPPVRVFSQRQVSWRIRPLRPVTGEIRWLLEGRHIAKSVVAGEGFRYHARRSTRSLWEVLRYPAERLPPGQVEWIEIDYPPADLGLPGLETHWSIWFAAFSMLGAILSPLGR